jgi:radical SAM superfamily enzyme YgiQ (UPF0313 family)
MIGGQIRDALWFTDMFASRFPQASIVWGGALPTLLPELTLSNQYVEYAVKGPGETAFLKLCDRLQDGEKNILHDLDISIRDNGKVLSGTFMVPDQFSALPYDWALISPSNYIVNDPDIANRTINYISSYGCEFGCDFCSDSRIFDYRWIGMHPKRITQDIAYLVSKHNVNGIKFYDSNFFNDPERALAFSERLLDSKFDINWGCTIHPRVFLSLREENLQVLSDSGCTRLMIGLESGSEKTLIRLRKGITSKESYQIAKSLADHGIIGSFTYIIGFPFETGHDIEATYYHAEQVRQISKNHRVDINVFSPYPGTKLYDYCVSNTDFVPPKNLEGWAEYYNNNLGINPWLPEDEYLRVRDFNKNNKLFNSPNSRN